ncbi:ArsR/SmtB family transcription factor [Brevibacillus dissolubilis]|uniref:ArsR/SmtB family transcription factor n=1 Tax=Brevibacillus dissolubilis TaxID=1844116 RepID=UPI001115E8B2|nr:metalloregulator ArsR/SmtB family transcription factor [Brevibacillus dissolubilis]
MADHTEETCDIPCLDETKVNRVKPRVGESEGVAKIFKALADDTRAKIIYALALEQELCVCDVANITGSTMANTSHHLRLLRNMGLAKSRKEGKLVFYSLDDDHVKHLILAGVEHIQECKSGH